MLIDADGTHPGVVAYFQKAALGGTRTAPATAEHITTTMENGILVPRTLSMEHGADAELTFEAIPIKSGSDDPLAFDEAAAIPTDVYPSASQVFTLGKVDLNSTEITGLKRAEITFGHELDIDAGESDIYPTFVSIDQIIPEITLGGVEVDVLSTLTEDGVYYAAETVTIYAKKRAEGGTFASNVSEVHIKFTLGKCRVEYTSISGSPKTIDMKITPWYTHSGSPVSPIAVDTTAAIT
jgi:hypothetical protein